jgi:hypothetical protein
MHGATIKIRNIHSKTTVEANRSLISTGRVAEETFTRLKVLNSDGFDNSGLLE